MVWGLEKRHEGIVLPDLFGFTSPGLLYDTTPIVELRIMLCLPAPINNGNIHSMKIWSHDC